MTRRIKITCHRLKAGKLVPDYRHLPVNLQIQKRASKKVRAGKAAVNPPYRP